MRNVAVGPRGKAQKVALKPLRRFAAKLPPSSLLREILLDEPEDELDVREFLGRVHVWLQLLRWPEFLGFEGRESKSVLSGKNFERGGKNSSVTDAA